MKPVPSPLSSPHPPGRLCPSSSYSRFLCEPKAGMGPQPIPTQWHHPSQPITTPLLHQGLPLSKQWGGTHLLLLGASFGQQKLKVSHAQLQLGAELNSCKGCQAQLEAAAAGPCLNLFSTCSLPGSPRYPPLMSPTPGPPWHPAAAAPQASGGQLVVGAGIGGQPAAAKPSTP